MPQCNAVSNPISWWWWYVESKKQRNAMRRMLNAAQKASPAVKE
jgi:hypothetical protein